MKPGSQNARLLAVLRDGPATNRDIHERAGHMVVNSRCAELRKHGYVIECDYIGGTGAGAYRYTLVSEPPPLSAGPKAGFLPQVAPTTEGLTDGASQVAFPAGAAQQPASALPAQAGLPPILPHPAWAQLSLEDAA